VWLFLFILNSAIILPRYPVRINFLNKYKNDPDNIIKAKIGDTKNDKKPNNIKKGTDRKISRIKILSIILLLGFFTKKSIAAPKYPFSNLVFKKAFESDG
tara:strand:+ start:2054 stop:2353 length:300 start_codon:yes stop_codon:yes gene_type:complete